MVEVPVVVVAGSVTPSQGRSTNGNSLLAKVQQTILTYSRSYCNYYSRSYLFNITPATCTPATLLSHRSRDSYDEVFVVV